MTKAKFLQELAARLSQLPPEEINEHLAYYDELLSDMIEDGLSEDSAVNKLGDPMQIAREILKDLPVQTLVKERFRPKNGWTAAAVAALIISCPIWLSLLIAALACIAAIFISFVAVGASLFVCVLSLFAAAVFTLFHSFGLFSLGIGYGIFSLGAGFILLGIVCLGFLGAQYAAIGLFKGGRRLFRSLKGLMIKKEV